MRWMFVLLIGAGLGVVAAIGNAGTGPDQTPTVHAMTIVASLGTIWAMAATLGGWLLARAPWSVLAGPMVLVAAAFAYYFWGVATGNRVHSFSDLSNHTQLLIVAGVLMGPLLGLLGGVARTGDWAGTVARVVVPVGLAGEIVVRYPLHGAEYGTDPVRAWTATCLLVAGVLAAVLAMVSGQTSSQ